MKKLFVILFILIISLSAQTVRMQRGSAFYVQLNSSNGTYSAASPSNLRINISDNIALVDVPWSHPLGLFNGTISGTPFNIQIMNFNLLEFPSSIVLVYNKNNDVSLSINLKSNFVSPVSRYITASLAGGLQDLSEKPSVKIVFNAKEEKTLIFVLHPKNEEYNGWVYLDFEDQHFAIPVLLKDGGSDILPGLNLLVFMVIVLGILIVVVVMDIRMNARYRQKLEAEKEKGNV